MEFNPNNNIIRYCIQAMDMEEKNKPEEAKKLFLQGWAEATNDFEKYLTAFFVARHQDDISDKLQWLETSLQLALKINSDTVHTALPTLYFNIAKCYEGLGDIEKAKKYNDIAISHKENIADKLPFLSWHKSRFTDWRFINSRRYV